MGCYVSHILVRDPGQMLSKDSLLMYLVLYLGQLSKVNWTFWMLGQALMNWALWPKWDVYQLARTFH
jgi:hypothetical protein